MKNLRSKALLWLVPVAVAATGLAAPSSVFACEKGKDGKCHCAECDKGKDCKDGKCKHHKGKKTAEGEAKTE
jgi:hypothetical protein